MTDSRVLLTKAPRLTEKPTLPELDAVPRYVLASKVRNFIASLGFDLTDMSESGIRIGWPCIEADIYSTRAVDTRYADQTTGHPAMHRICIPIIEDADA